MYLYYAFVDKDNIIKVFPLHIRSTDVAWFKKHKEIEEQRIEHASFSFKVRNLEEYIDPIIVKGQYERRGFTGCSAVLKWDEEKVGKFYFAGRGFTEWEEISPDEIIEIDLYRKNNGNYVADTNSVVFIRHLYKD